ncbi:MAG: hypothetical protein FOGNACKC_04344 [Anaerolineae bacterium]|nr:hypothetical protein [Anaerolineae bacterium]
MRTKQFYKNGFIVAAVYDLLLGVVFFFFYQNIFNALSVPLPNNGSYAQLSAAFVFVQGISYYFVFQNLQRNIDIVKVGLIYKIVYSGVAFYYWAIGGLPHPMFALFGFLDLIFVVFFVLYLADYITVIQEAR